MKILLSILCAVLIFIMMIQELNATIRLKRHTISNPTAEFERWKLQLVESITKEGETTKKVTTKNVLDHLATHYEKRTIEGQDHAKPGMVFIQFKSLSSKNQLINNKREEVVNELNLVEHEKFKHYIPDNTFLVASKNVYATLNKCQKMKEVQSCLPFERQYKTVIEPIVKNNDENKEYLEKTLLSKILEKKETIKWNDPEAVLRQRFQLDTELETMNRLETQFKEAENHNELVNKQYKMEIMPLYENPEDNVKHLKAYMAKQQMDIRVIPDSNRIYIVQPTKADDKVLTTLADYPMLLELARKPVFAFHNHAGNQILQSGQGNGPMSIWENGVTGKDQIVGVGDTGIDWDNCFFYDSETPMKFDEPMPTHRKIHYYYPIQVKTHDSNGNIVDIRSDTQDMVDGHGTHVTGSVMGQMKKSHQNYQNLTEYTGVAPDSRMFFTDIQSPKYPGLLLPNDLTDYFSIAYKNGARIHSNSWGQSIVEVTCIGNCECYWNPGNSFGANPYTKATDAVCREKIGRRCCEWVNVYDSLAVSVDKFLNENKDMTILFAAGNNGRISKYGNLGSPATAKNVLTIGASISTNENLLDSVDHTNYDPIFAALKAQNIKSITDCCNYVGENELSIQFLCCPNVTRKLYENAKSIYYNEHSLSDFTSKGPIPADNRIKPDVVAPGMKVISMFSDGDVTTHQCGVGQATDNSDAAVVTKQGTSMATPLTAGAAALVRDYLQHHYAPTQGDKYDKNDIQGELIKAMIIHSAQPLTGNYVSGNLAHLNDTYPNNQVGFGIVNLTSVLRFPSTSKFDLFTYQHEIETGHDHRIVKCFVTTSNTNLNLRATLTWYDPPGSTVSQVALMNDMELNVFTGNVSASEKTVWYPGNNNTDHDLVNTVEQVRWKVSKENTLNCVTVQGISYAQGFKQTFALVVTATPDDPTDNVTGDSYLNEIPNCEAPPRPNDSTPFDWKIVWLIILAVFLSLCVFVAGVVITILLIRFCKKRRSGHVPLDTHHDPYYTQD